VFGIGPQEHHLLAAPVGYSKTQHAGVKLRYAIDVRGVEDDVTHRSGRDVLRMRFIAVAGHTRGELDTSPVGIDETQSITSARLVQRVWLLDKPYAGCFQPGGRMPQRCLIGHGIGDVVQSFRCALVKAQQEILRGGAPEKGGTIVFNDSFQTPNFRVKTRLLRQTRRKKADMPDLSDAQSHIHRCTTFSRERSSRGLTRAKARDYEHAQTFFLTS